ncbi:MAG TPA: hypothetical protein VF469_28715 [Kofleriaceae bacterium]
MVAVSTPPRTFSLSWPPAPRIFERVIGRMLVLMINAVERRRDQRLELAR